MDIDLSNVDTVGLMVLQQYTNDAIIQNVINVLIENQLLKNKLKEIIHIANLVPLLMNPILSCSITALLQPFNKFVIFFNVVKAYILDNICQILEIIDGAWQVVLDLTRL